MRKFLDFNLDSNIQKGIDAAGFTVCTPVQEETFDALFDGHDVTVKSQTGTGKTAAFLISLFQIIINVRKSHGEGEHQEQVLILAPTRELVVQITEEAQVLGEFLDYTFCSIYGGVSYHKQKQQLAENPDFLICTPGRLLDFMREGTINLRTFNYLVIDEADRMFDMGFYPDIRSILRTMKPAAERRTLLFSATLGTKVLNIAWNFMNNPKDIEIEPEQVTVDAISQTLYHVSREEKISLLLGLIKKHRPESAIFFTNTKRMAEELSFRLRANEFTAEFMMGDLPQKKRLKIIQSLKNKEIRFLVATDVAARGLHIDDLSMVFNYDLPEDPENYVHRIGRTARAGNIGIAISLADERDVYNLPAIEKFITMKIPTDAVSTDLLEEDVSRNMRFRSEYSRQDSRSRPGQGRHSGTSSQSRSSSRSNDRSRHSDSRSNDRSRRSDSRSNDRNRRSDSRSNDRKPYSENRKPYSENRNSYSEKRPHSRSGEKNQHSGEARRQKRGGASSEREKISSSMTEQQRLAHYAQKYGDNFAVKGKTGTGGSKKPSRVPPPTPKSTAKKGRSARASEQHADKEKSTPPKKKGLLARLHGAFKKP